jgi:hypothetical protein
LKNLFDQFGDIEEFSIKIFLRIELHIFDFGVKLLKNGEDRKTIMLNQAVSKIKSQIVYLHFLDILLNALLDNRVFVKLLLFVGFEAENRFYFL